MSVVQITRETVTVTERHAELDLRRAVVEVIRHQEGLKRKLHELLEKLGSNGGATIG